MEFIWNDGGRAASGYVGIAGDCVTRAIAIATGTSYRDVYQSLGTACLKSPRDGVSVRAAAEYLAAQGWRSSARFQSPFVAEDLPQGVVIVHLYGQEWGSQHFCTVIDHVVHDTWNPADDDEYTIERYWTPCRSRDETRLPMVSPKRRVSKEQELTQKEFDTILKRLRALDATANNGASTEGEKRNALRMMQNLMLRHNLSRDDIVDEDNVDHVQFTRMACPVNGRRAYNWEKMLASYLTLHVFPTIQWYQGTKGHRTFFWFYGPLEDVQNGIALFRELLLTIAAAAHLQYGSHTRGSGASYAEGYVSGLPRSTDRTESSDPQVLSAGVLIHTRTLALNSAAREWLALECNIRLTSLGRGGRSLHDDAAASRGKSHGASHKFNVPGARQRLTHRQPRLN